MNYKTFEPIDALKPYVKYFWCLQNTCSGISQKNFRTIADGCPGLIFQNKDSGIFSKNDTPLPGIFLFGPTTKYAAINITGNFNTIGAYFYPNALKSVFGFNAFELTDSCLDADMIAQKYALHLSDQLQNISTPENQIKALSFFLMKELNANKKDDLLMQHALNMIIFEGGNVSITKLRQHLNISERNFERRFKQYVGISPKLFSRICLFQKTLKQLQNNQFNKMSDIAFDNDYSDQSHFIRTFKEFAGFSPQQYQAQSIELVENFSEVTK